MPASPPPEATPHELSPTQVELTTTAGHLETLSRQILAELRRAQEQPEVAFSVSKLLAGIVQILVLAGSSTHTSSAEKRTCHRF